MRRVEQRHSDGREGAGNPTGRAEAEEGEGKGGGEGRQAEGDGSEGGGSSRAFSGVESTKRLHKKKNRLRSFSIPL